MDFDLRKFLPEDGDAEWLKSHVPLLDCPDGEFMRTYYFRWTVFRKHLKPTPHGYIISEFLPEVPWAGPYNSISCGAGHHYYEGRWLHDPVYLNDYTDFWFRKEGEPRSYSFWAADSLYAYYAVTGNAAFVVEYLPDLISNYEAWEAERSDPSGLFWQIDDRDGMEMSIGGSGLRATINSYMYGDAIAIARIAELAGNIPTAELFHAKAARTKQLVKELLWDEEDRFFKVRVNEQGLAYSLGMGKEWNARLTDKQLASGQLVDIRELHGYVPWYFGLPSAGYEEAWSRLMDPKEFYTPFGPTTAQRSHPLFMCEHSHECLWNGPSWPYATTQTLTAMARLLREYDQTYVNEQDYFELLRNYSGSHRRKKEDGRVVPWIDENLDPFTGEWIARARLREKNDANQDRGEDYNHSAFCDLVISGLIGIVPRGDSLLEISPLLPPDAWDYFRLDNVVYHGRMITLQYDKDGFRYRNGQGLRIYEDGELIAESEHIQRMIVPLKEKSRAMQPIQQDKGEIENGKR